MKSPTVYIKANRYRGSMYVGVSSDLLGRASQHRLGLVEGFTKKYRLRLLVFWESHATMEYAITREKQLKDWKRAWKISLIEKTNPDWKDLFESPL